MVLLCKTSKCLLPHSLLHLYIMGNPSIQRKQSYNAWFVLLVRRIGGNRSWMCTLFFQLPIICVQMHKIRYLLILVEKFDYLTFVLNNRCSKRKSLHILEHEINTMSWTVDLENIDYSCLQVCYRSLSNLKRYQKQLDCIHRIIFFSGITKKLEDIFNIFLSSDRAFWLQKDCTSSKLANKFMWGIFLASVNESNIKVHLDNFQPRFMFFTYSSTYF